MGTARMEISGVGLEAIVRYPQEICVFLFGEEGYVYVCCLQIEIRSYLFPVPSNLRTDDSFDRGRFSVVTFYLK